MCDFYCLISLRCARQDTFAPNVISHLHHTYNYCTLHAHSSLTAVKLLCLFALTRQKRPSHIDAECSTVKTLPPALKLSALLSLLLLCMPTCSCDMSAGGNVYRLDVIERAVYQQFCCVMLLKMTTNSDGNSHVACYRH